MGWFVNEFPKWVIVFLYLGANFGIGTYYYFKFSKPVEYYYLREVIGKSLPMARASAAVLNFNCMLILLPVCRNLLSFVRGSCACCPKVVRRTLDKNLSFHKLVAYMICVATAIHFWSHTFNFERFLRAYDQPEGSLAYELSQKKYKLNPIESPDTNPMLELVQTVAGITGVLITLSLILIVSSATTVIRRSYFEVFWFTHHLFAVFFVALVIHGAGGLVKSQSNVDRHDPEKCKEMSVWGKEVQCPGPEFKAGGPKTWMWVVGPMFLYICERCIRFWRSTQRVVITKVVIHPSRVVELQMKKKGFKMQSGQYIFLHCPSISRLEWHPFTLTSAPQEDYFSVHIRTVGDWTTALSKLCSDGDGQKQSGDLPIVAVDGPFGTASEDVYDYEVDILVAAGIGVTPFASVLKDIWYRYQQPTYFMKLRKVYFYWICPDTNAFEWFADLLKEMEVKMVESGRTELFNCNIYLTRGWTSTDAARMFANAEEIYDTITNLRSKTEFGRPNWDSEFQSVVTENPGCNVGVFFCGPEVLSNQLSTMSNKHSKNPENTTFFFNKENF